MKKASSSGSSPYEVVGAGIVFGQQPAVAGDAIIQRVLRSTSRTNSSSRLSSCGVKVCGMGCSRGCGDEAKYQRRWEQDAAVSGRARHAHAR